MSIEPWIYTGPWTNWSEGRILGSRFTLTTEGAAYLIAFLAIFVRLAGQHFWSIFCYFYFQWNVSHTAQDGLHHEQQVLLRNNPNEAAAAWRFLRLGLVWRGRAPGSLRRSLNLAIYAIVHLLLFTAAAVFTSKVASAESGVLLRGVICGSWVNPFAFDQYTKFSLPDLSARNKWQGWHVEEVKSAATFAQQCYNTTDAASSLANCKAYGPGLLNWTLSTDIDCPFDAKMCANDTVVRLDSGLLDSQDDFGINSPRDRVKYRTILDCAPIVQDGYRSDILNLSTAEIGHLIESGLAPEIVGEQFREFYYGDSWYFNTTATYTWNNMSFGVPTGNMEISKYLIDMENSVLGNLESGTFTAIPELNRTDADVVLFFLQSNTAYLVITIPATGLLNWHITNLAQNEVLDPWFQATKPRPFTQQSVEDGGIPTTVTFHFQNNNASVMGCAQQHQFCNRDGSRCSELTGGAAGSNTEAMLNFAKDLELTPRETAIQQRLYRAAWNNWIYQTSGFLTGSGLLASRVGSGKVSTGLPNNQWIVEVQSWFATGLTGIQMELATYITGPKDPSTYEFITRPSGVDEQWMCDNQIVQRDGYDNLSGLGVGLIVGIGGLVILVDLLLHRMVRTFRFKSSYDLEGRAKLDWDSAEALELMRLAKQDSKMSHWQGESGNVPETGKGEKFARPTVEEKSASDSSSSSTTRRYTFDAEGFEGQPAISAKQQQEDIKSGLVFSASIDPDDSIVR